MKIALFSDIHANLPAFEAMLADLDDRQADAVYCLGDLVGYNIWPNEIITETRRRGIATLAGNHDQKIEGYAYKLVTEENRSYLTTLPTHIRLEFQLNQDHLNLVFAHGSTRSINEYVLEDSDEAYLLEMMNEAKADILCVGHSHKPFHRTIGVNKHVINIGSVGKPKDGNPQGCYVLLNLDKNGTVSTEFRRFDYNIDQAVQAIIDSPLPDELADKLIKAY